MAFETTPLGEYFLLRDRQSFSIEPWRDQRIFFGDQKLAERIVKRLESDFVQPRGVPKFFVFGSYGSGKTHTLAHIRYVLESQRLASMYPTEPIYVDIAPLSARERYERIHARLLDAIGVDRVKLAAESVADQIEGDKVKGFIECGVLPLGDEALKVSQANVFRNLLFGGRQAQLSWEWMRGRKTSVEDAQTLGTQKDLLEPQDYVNCLLNLGALHQGGTKKRIVFLVDEAESFRSVTHPDSQTELLHVIRLLLENSNTFVGLILAIQTEGGMEQIGQFFTSPDIMRRVDYEHGYIDLTGMVAGVGDAEEFIKQVIEYLVDQQKAASVVEEEGLGTSAEIFPFTEEAIAAISAHISGDPERALPASIIAWMSNAAVEAWRRRNESEVHQLVTADIIEETIYPEG